MAGGRTDGLIKNFKAGGAIAPRRLVKFGSDDVTVVQAAGPTDAVIGVSIELAAAAGERVDVAMSDIAEIELGGPVTRGTDLLTSDAQGRGVAAAPAAGANVRVAGQALVSGVLGDIATVHLQKSVMQG